MILNNPFYHGVFEYPRKSGNWYQGKHEAIITKELYDQVQEQITRSVIRTEGKEFAFTKLMFCGFCGSGITPDEKFKKQKDGSVHRHVYYGCNKSKDKDCKCGYISEIDLIKQFENLIDKVDLNELEIKGKIKEELDRFKKFQKIILCSKQKVEVPGIDVKDYAKYVLREGKDLEKRELMSCFKNKILLIQKQVSLA